MDTPKPLSVAIITRDEEDRLPACLQSLGFADEILVVDSGSTDRTVQVAGSYGARVLIEAWRGFSEQKQFAVDSCSHDWVLVLDADERVPQETASVITGIMRNPEPETAAYSFVRKNYFHGRWIKHCGWWPDRIVRLVDRRRGRFDGEAVHERWVVQGTVRDLGAALKHVSFRNYSEMMMKMECYSNLSSLALFQRNAKVRAFTPITHGIWMFLKSYVLEMGILDGFDGFFISMANAGGSFLKYAKLREYRKSGQERS
ncbi:MAG: glycosyltransferase family 2 protein [Deltaproteobacteria bacterium]|nr:glycosyltransferase family 2 protein [Deltaproteobacteria bacterium]